MNVWLGLDLTGVRNNSDTRGLLNTLEFPFELNINRIVQRKPHMDSARTRHAAKRCNKKHTSGICRSLEYNKLLFSKCCLEVNVIMMQTLMFKQVLKIINYAINLCLENYWRFLWEKKNRSLIWVIQMNHLMQIQKSNEQVAFIQW